MMNRFFTLLLAASCLTAVAQSDCSNLHDSNSDGAVTISDLLDLLGLFGDVDADQDGIWDSVDECVDTGACNYAADPTEPCAYIDVLGDCGGGCEGDGDGDGICDDEDDCVGVLDECGVCNGPGPTEIVIEDITILYDSVYAEQIDQWFVFEVGADTTFSYTCAPFFGDCGDPVSYQGYDYATVLIGDQCWFAENLRSEHYESGDLIPSGLSDSEWSSTTTGATAIYGEGESFCQGGTECDPLITLELYGRLYNWYSVNDDRRLCPNNWHVPTEEDWITLELQIGMSPSETMELGFRGDKAPQLKSTSGWHEGGNGTNASGFIGLPGGARYGNGSFYVEGIAGRWWSSTPAPQEFFLSDEVAWIRSIHDNPDGIERYVDGFVRGRSVRCVRDAE